MKTILIISCLLLSPFFISAQDDVLIWSDEFDVDGPPNNMYWGYDLGSNGGWGNNELESYTSQSSNVRVAGGLLIIDALKSGGNWTSGRIKTQNKFNFTYGRIKYRAKLATGTGTWPALWMLAETITSKGWPACGEIDVMEHVGKEPGVVHSTLHTTSSSGNSVNTKTKIVSTYASEFHEYEAYWTPDKIQFSIDGVAFYTYQPATKTAANWPFNTPFFIIMNLAIGGNFGGTVDASLTSAEMQVDYVRVYQSFSLFSLQGPTAVEKNQNDITYEIINLKDATYSWSVPDDAVITSGDETNKITVTWGETEGDVRVVVSLNGTYEKSIFVSLVTKPTGSIFPLQSNEFSTFWVKNPENPNLFPFESQLPLRVDYTVAAKVSSPALIGTFSKSLDLSDHPVLRAKVKTYNKSKTVNLRMDLVDATGTATTKSPAFTFTPIIDDGEYYKYSFNFLDENKWASAIGPVDNKRISKINFYIDYGINAVTGYDSVWVDSLWVEQAQTSLLPNRPSHLYASENGSITFHWQDNSINESGFEIFQSPTKDSQYNSISSVGENETTATIAASGTPAYYFVKAKNTIGYSDASNRISSTEIITAIESEKVSIKLYPNPTSENLRIEGLSSPASIQLKDMLGREVIYQEAHGTTSIVDVSSLRKGTYIIQIKMNNSNSIKKIILQ